MFFVSKMSDINWSLLSSRVRWHRFLIALEKVEDLTAGQYFMIKGFAALFFYPINENRSFADFDFVVDPSFFQHSIKDRFQRLSAYNIDVHFGIRDLDRLPWKELFDRCRVIEIEGTHVRVPCPEDHLRIMAVHWLTDGGEYKERLWDIYYAVANRPADFDWNKCLDVVSPTRRKWVITTIGLANKYLGLEIDDLPFADEAKDIPKWIIKTVEREWAREVRLIPLRIAYRKPRMLIEQIRKRLPPNPITATIDMEGEFDDRPRIWYQLGSIAKRIPPSLRRFVDLAKARLRR